MKTKISDCFVQMKVNEIVDFLSMEWQRLSPEQIKRIYAATRQAYYSVQLENEYNRRIYG